MTTSPQQLRSEPRFPFTAIVGQTAMKRALILNAINTRIGGVLIRGKKGTAKSTAVRSLAALLPEVSVLRGCPYSCPPENRQGLCQWCQPHGEEAPAVTRQVRIVDLPVGATEDRLVGSLDIEQAIRAGSRSVEPGLIAATPRGILCSTTTLLTCCWTPRPWAATTWNGRASRSATPPSSSSSEP